MTIIIFDFETNGLLNDKNFQPIEFCAIIVKDNIIIKEIQHYIKCPFPLSDKIKELTKITDEQLETKGIDIDVLKIILVNLFIHEDYDLIVSHNGINFDIPIIENLINVSLEKSKQYDTAGEFKSKLLNLNIFENQTFYNFHKYVLSLKRKGIYFNLLKAIEYYEINLNNESLHNAKTDVYYTFEVFKKQINNIEKEFKKRFPLKN